MGVIRRVRDTKMSASRRTPVASVVQDAPRMVPAHSFMHDERDESDLREHAAFAPEPMAFEACGPDEEHGPFLETGVNRIAPRRAPASGGGDARGATEPKAAQAATAAVTLFVYGWDQVEPGDLSWVFPSLRAALDAVRTMRNAVVWCICSGESWSDVESARAKGAVLIEQLR